MTDTLPHASSSPQHETLRHSDVIVLGGSAAGLTAALQLARQRRSVLVVDDGTPRNASAAHMHGYLGREGTPPAELRAIGREEVRSYGGEILTGHIVSVTREHGTFVVALADGHRLSARRVVVATGISDELPPIDGLAERWGREVIHCPFCHGYEVRDQRIVHIVTSAMGLHPARLLQHLSAHLTIVVHDGVDVARADLDRLAAAGVTIVEGRVQSVTDGADAPLAIRLADGATLDADAVMVASRFHARVDTLAPLGLRATDHASGLGEVLAIDESGQTEVRGVYAAGNVTDPGMQVLAAAAHGGLVGARLAFDLADDDLESGERGSAARREWNLRYGAAPQVWSGRPNGTFVAEAGTLAPGRALDVGAGEGADALWLSERGWQVTASDVSDVALARIDDEARRRGQSIRTLRADADDLGAFGADTYDLVSLQYGSFRRSPEQRGLRNLLDAVAVGGTLLVVGHDHGGHAQGGGVYDAAAYVSAADVVRELAESDAWAIELDETRPRPAGAISAGHVSDVVVRARRLR